MHTLRLTEDERSLLQQMLLAEMDAADEDVRDKGADLEYELEQARRGDGVNEDPGVTAMREAKAEAAKYATQVTALYNRIRDPEQTS